MATGICALTGTVNDASSAAWTGVCYIQQIGDTAAAGGYVVAAKSVVTAGVFTSTNVVSPSDLRLTFVNSDGRIAYVVDVSIPEGETGYTLEEAIGAATSTDLSSTHVVLPSASLAAATAQSTPSDPTGTTDTTGKMMGCAVAITPRKSGKIAISVSGDIGNDTAADAAKCKIYYGTGTAPTNGAAPTGTAVGNMATTTGLTALVTRFPFHCNAVVTGLTVGTAYWVDLLVAAITGGTATAKNLSVSIIEL